MSRPKLPDDQLLHPRRIRKSPLRSTVTDIPKATKASIKRWEPLAKLCIAAVLSNDRTDNLGIKQKVTIFFAKKDKKPAGFPIGRVVEVNDNGTAIEYNAEGLLVWLYDRGLTPYTPTQLYQAKRGLLTNFEIDIDNAFDIELL